MSLRDLTAVYIRSGAVLAALAGALGFLWGWLAAIQSSGLLVGVLLGWIAGLWLALIFAAAAFLAWCAVPIAVLAALAVAIWSGALNGVLGAAAIVGAIVALVLGAYELRRPGAILDFRAPRPGNDGPRP